jgi:hypothetical protein
MASLVYNSWMDDLVRAKLDFATDTFRMMLVTSAYTPNKDTHTKRSDVTNEITGTGYTAGGAIITPTISLDTANDRLNITWSSPSWNPSTITARAGVIYKARGGAANLDELITYIDFGGDISSANGPFTATVTSPLRLQN